jgi:hypothetical protein
MILGLSIGETLMLCFTGAIAISTIMYSVVSLKTLRTIRDSTENDRLNYIFNMMQQFSNLIERERSTQPPEAIRFLDEFGSIIFISGLNLMLEDLKIDRKKAAKMLPSIEQLCKNYNVDPKHIPVFNTLFDKLKNATGQ